MLNLKIITPQKKVLEKEVKSITCRTVNGEITVLPRHCALLTLLADGVITVRDSGGSEEFFSAGSGYIETDGITARILISRAAGQDELDERKVNEAREQAKKILAEQKNASDRRRALAMLQRTTLDLKVVKKLKHKHS
jgi:F-type H+-transporting ATPase subunit epsilon